jgi:hypothetical protein
MVYRTARCGLRVTRAQNSWRRRRQDAPLAGYQELCRELAKSGPGTFGELDSTGARSVLRRYSDAWFAAAKRRQPGTARRGSLGAGAAWSRPAGTRARSPWTGECCASRSPAAARRSWSAWTGTCPTRRSRSGQ